MLFDRTERISSLVLASLLAVAVGGCNLVLGLDDFTDATTASSGGAGGQATTGSGGSGGAGGQATTGSGGSGGSGGAGGQAPGLVVSPEHPTMGVLRALTFSAPIAVTWSVQEPAGGTIDAGGRYLSPETPGTYHVIATSKSDGSQSATATVTVNPLGISIAGGIPGGSGTLDGPALRARFTDVRGIGLGNQGEGVLVADREAHTIRRIQDSSVTTLAGLSFERGSVDGLGVKARFAAPTSIAFNDFGGNNPVMWVLDGEGTCVRSVVPMTGEASTLAGECGTSDDVDGSGGQARFNAATSMAYNQNQKRLYLCQWNKIREIDVNTKTVRSIDVSSIGNGGCDLITTNGGIIYFTQTNTIFRLEPNPAAVCKSEEPDPCVVKVAWSDERIDALAAVPDGAYIATSKGLEHCGVANDGSGTCKPVVEVGEQAVDGPVATARVHDVAQLVAEYGVGGDVYFSDSDGLVVRKLSVDPLKVSTVAGVQGNDSQVNGERAVARLRMPVGLALGDKGEILVTDIAMDGGPANTIRAIDASTGAIRTLAGKPHADDAVTMVDGAHDKAVFGLPWSMARLGAAVYVTDLLGHAVRSVDVATGVVTTFAGKLGEEGFVDAAGDKARFRLDFGNYGAGSGIATDGTNLYVADTGNFAIRKILPNKDVVTLAGGTEGSADGTGTGAQFMAPSAVAYASGFLYVVDHKDYTIRRVDVATGEVKTIVGIAGKATGIDGGVGVGTLAGPLGVAADGFGSLYVTDLSPTSNLRGAVVRRVDLSTRTIGPFAGTPRLLGLAVGPLPSTVNMPIGLLFDDNGDLLFADVMDGALGAIKPL